MGASILQEIISLLVGGITGIAQGIGQGVSTLAQSIFLQTTGTGADAVTTLSTFGVFVAIFAGISLAIGLSTKIFMWLSTLGGRK